MTNAQRRCLGNIIALGGSGTTGNGTDHVGAVRTSVVTSLKRLGLVELGPRKQTGICMGEPYFGDTWYATAKGCLAYGAEVAVLR